MIESFFNGLLSESRLLSVLHDNLSNGIKSDKLYSYIQGYLEKYARFNNISTENAVNTYNNFIAVFNKHCKQFNKSGKYPIEKGAGDFFINREDYDIVLLMSVLLTPHRFRIMQLLHNAKLSGKALFIGLGPGLELSLTKENFKETQAYDLSVNKFLFSEFPGIQLNMESYVGQKQNYFDVIYLIELLEHLQDPWMLLEICYRSLKTGGKVFLTTATDIPQFDHLYNFPKDHSLFDAQIKNLGFAVLYKEMIPHNYLTIQINPCNHFYTLKKI